VEEGKRLVDESDSEAFRNEAVVDKTQREREREREVSAGFSV